MGKNVELAVVTHLLLAWGESSSTRQGGKFDRRTRRLGHVNMGSNGGVVAFTAWGGHLLSWKNGVVVAEEFAFRKMMRDIDCCLRIRVLEFTVIRSVSSLDGYDGSLQDLTNGV